MAFTNTGVLTRPLPLFGASEAGYALFARLNNAWQAFSAWMQSSKCRMQDAGAAYGVTLQ